MSNDTHPSDEQPEATATGPTSALPRHRFDPLSAALGIGAVLGCTAVAIGGFDNAEIEGGTLWITAAAILVGLITIPWGGRGSLR